MLQIVVFRTLDFASASLQLVQDNGFESSLPARADLRPIPLAYVDAPLTSEVHDTPALIELVERVLDAGERACFELGGWTQLI